MVPRVLVVEDSALVVAALRLLLEESGFTVHAAADVVDAVAHCRATPPDAMLLDLRLRDGSGFDVLAELRATAAMPRVVIAITGDDSVEIRDRCLENGCREVLVKPIRSLELPKRIRALLEESS